MALDYSRERYGSKALPKGAELTGEQILSNIKPESVQKADSFLTKFKNDTNDFIKSFNKDFGLDTDDEEERRRKSFNAADYFEERRKQADDLKSRLEKAAESLETNAEYYTPEYYESMVDYLSNFNTMVDDVLSYYKPSLDSREGMRAYEDELIAAMERNAQLQQVYDLSDRYSDRPVGVTYDLMNIFRKPADESDRAVKDNWTAEQRYLLGTLQMEDPNAAKEYARNVNAGKDPYLLYQQQEQQKANWLAMDLDAEKREIDRLKAELDDYYWNTDYDATSTNARNAFDQEIRRREQEISNREQQYNLAKREQESAQFRSALDQSDFAAKSGYVGTGFEVPKEVNIEDPQLVYEYINNPEIRRQVDYQDRGLERKGYHTLNPEEVSLYNYHYATEGPERAQQYLDNLQTTLSKRRGDVISEQVKDSTWKQYLFGAAAGFTNAFESVHNLFSKEDYIPLSPNQYASANIREDLADTGPVIPGIPGGASLGQIGYDLVNTTANMVPSILLSTAANAVLPGSGAFVGAATMGLSSAGGAYQQALNAGYSKEQSRAYAALSGASEAGMEYLLGGISKLGGEIPQKVLNDMVRGVDNAIAKAALTIGGDMVSEGFEEGLQEIITPWLENLLLYADKDVNWDDVAYSTLLGALSGGVMEGPSVAINTNRVSGVEKQLKDLGAKANTWELAELIVKHRAGEQLSQEDYIKLVKSEPAMKILDGMRNAESEPDIANMTTEQVEEMKPTTSKDGNARQISRNESINVDGFAEVKDGKAKVRTDDGTVDYQDVSFATEKEGNQYFAVEGLQLLDTEHANKLLQTIQKADVGKDTAEVLAIREAYRLGYMDADTRDLRGSDAQILSTKLQDQIYSIGKEQRTVNDSIRATAAGVRSEATKGYKKVIIEGKLSNLTEDAAKKRKAEIAYVDRVADTFAGTAVHVYESYEKNGKRYYRDNSGKEQLAPNGKYVNDEIWVDLNSGDNGEGLVLNTFAHEMYHHIEKWNKPKARELAEFLVKELGLESVDKAVSDQIEKARAAGYGEGHFVGMTPEQARNEVYMRAMSDFVADSLETMFTRGNPAEAIANLKKENKGLFDQIKAFIDEWISKVKKFYGDKTISQEGAVVAQLEKFEQLQQMFMEAMQGAGENYQAALANADEKSTTQEGDAKLSNRRDSVQADITSKYQKTVDQILSLQNTKKDHVLIGYTPKIYEDLGMPSLPFVIGTGHIYSAAKTEAEAKLEGNYRKGVNYHGLGASVVKNIYEKLNDPVMIIASKDINKNAMPMRSTHSVVAIVDVGNAQKSLLLPVEITAERTVDGVRMDVNALSSIYEKDVSNLVNEAIAVENTGDVGVFYAKKEALTLPGAGVQFPVLLQQSIASNSIVHRFPEKVNMNILDATQSQQFKRWFGDWQNDPQNASKVVNTDGTPKVMYHGTSSYGFRSFNTYGGKFGLFGKGSYFTDNPEVADSYTKKGKGDTPGVYDVYLNIKNPLDMDADANTSAWEKAFSYAGLDSSYLKGIKTNEDAFRALKENLADDGYVRWEAEEIVTDLIEGMGYDGITHIGGGRYGTKDGPRHRVYIAFNPEQIKSASENIGTFDGQNTDIYYSLRNQKATAREILMQTDLQTQKNNVKGHLARYQERVVQLGEAEARREKVKAQIETLSADPKKNRKELAQLRTENRNLTTQITGLKEKLKFSENTDMMRKIVANERLKNQPPAKSYKDEQEDFIRSMLAEHRVIRKELTGADSVMFVMEETFVKLAKDYEAKKIDMNTMEKEFMRIMKEYEALEEKSAKKVTKKAGEIKNLKTENKALKKEYDSLLWKYQKSGWKVQELEAKLERQKETAKARINKAVVSKIQRKVDELNRLLLHGTKHRNIPEYLQPIVAQLLDSINMETKDAIERANTFEATLQSYNKRIAAATDPITKEALIEKKKRYMAKGDQFAKKMAELKDAYQRIQDEKIPGLEIDEGLASRLQTLFVEVGNTPLREMTRKQLDAVNDVLNITEATITKANKMFDESQKQGVEENSKDTMREVRSVGGGPKKKLGLQKAIEEFGWNNLKPVQFFEAIGSSTLTNLFSNLRKGEDTLAVDLQEGKNFFQEQWKKNGCKEWNMEYKWKFTSTSGKSFELDLDQIMFLYALEKDKDARSHLRVGGFAFDSDYQTKEDINLGPVKIPVKVESTDASAYNLSDEILGEIISKLKPEQTAFVDAMQAYLSDTMAAKGNEVSLKKYGIRLFKKKDYFPIRVADQFMAKARAQQSGDWEIKNSGFTNDRKPEAKNPVVLSGFTKVWAEHVDEMSLYHSFVLPLDDFNRVLNYHDAFVEGEQAASVVEAIRTAYGEGATRYIDQLIRDINGGARTDSVASTINTMMSKAKKAQTMASLSVAIQQQSAILRACSMIDSKYFFGRMVSEKTQDRIWDEIKQHAPIAIIKEMGGFDTNVGKSTVDYLTDTADYNGFGEKFQAFFKDENFRDDVFGRLPAFMDEVAWSAIWNAVKREQSDMHPNMDVKSDAFMKLVADRFTDVIVHTQVYDSVFSRSGLMRSKDTGVKMATAFMAEPTTTANMLAMTMIKLKRGDIQKKDAAKTVGAIVSSLVLNSILVSLVYAMRDDDEDKRLDEKYIENLLSNFFESLNPLGYIPFLRDIQSVVRGYDVERSDMALYGDLINAIQGLTDEDKSAWDKTEAVIGSLGNLVGVPLKNILRDARGIVNTAVIALDADNKDRNTNTGYYMAAKQGLLEGMPRLPWKKVTDPTDKDEMILAIQRGDEEHLQRVFGRFESQKHAESALQSAIGEYYRDDKLTREETEKLLTENFDRDDEHDVYWILDKWDYAKEYGSSEGYLKYGKFFEGVESGDFEAEMERLLENGSDASEIRSQITRTYRKEYLADETVRESIREKLLPVYEATGMYADDIEQKFHDWDFEAEYGMTYSNFKAEYREGNVTEAEMRGAMDYYGLYNYEIEEGIRDLNDDIAFEKKFGMSLSELKDAYDNGDATRNQLIDALIFTGKTKTEATEEVSERDLDYRFGIQYAKLDDAYKYNDISRSEFYNAMREHGATQQEADEAILGYDWLKKNVKKYPDLAISDAKRFVIKVSDKMEERTLTDYGVSVDSYLKYKEGAKDCPGVDADGDGKIDSYSKAKQLFAMIDQLPISDEAKDGLALVTNAESTLRKYAPWRK